MNGPVFWEEVISGCLDFLGYKLSFQRAFYFLPFFIAGIIFSKKQKLVFSFKKSSSALIAVSMFCFFYFSEYLSSGLLYGSRSYSRLGLTMVSGIFLRVLLIVTGFLGIQFIFATSNWVPKSIMSRIGKNSFSVYLLHGAIIVLARQFDLIHIDNLPSMILYFLISVFLVVILGSELVTITLKRFKLI